MSVYKVRVLLPENNSESSSEYFYYRQATTALTGTYLDEFKSNLVHRYRFLENRKLNITWCDNDGDTISIFNEDDWRIFMEMNGTNVIVQADNVCIPTEIGWAKNSSSCKPARPWYPKNILSSITSVPISPPSQLSPSSLKCRDDRSRTKTWQNFDISGQLIEGNRLQKLFIEGLEGASSQRAEKDSVQFKEHKSDLHKPGSPKENQKSAPSFVQPMEPPSVITKPAPISFENGYRCAICTVPLKGDVWEKTEEKAVRTPNKCVTFDSPHAELPLLSSAKQANVVEPKDQRLSFVPTKEVNPELTQREWKDHDGILNPSNVLGSIIEDDVISYEEFMEKTKAKLTARCVDNDKSKPVVNSTWSYPQTDIKSKKSVTALPRSAVDGFYHSNLKINEAIIEMVRMGHDNVGGALTRIVEKAMADVPDPIASYYLQSYKRRHNMLKKN